MTLANNPTDQIATAWTKRQSEGNAKIPWNGE